MINKDKKIVNLGFIGCGKISEKHFSAISEHVKAGRVSIKSVCDIDYERSNAAAKLMDSKAYTDIDEMLKNEQLDIVTVATPNGLHPDHIKKVASYKIDVITDKPIATSLGQSNDVVNYCKNYGVRLFVVHQLRFNDCVWFLKKAIDQGRFGKIYMITSNVFWTRPQNYYDQTPWHGTKNMDGGAFLTQASHYVDLMQWFVQEKPTMVFANLKTLARKIETEDTGSAIFEWNKNIIGNLNVTMLTYPKNYEGSITILGEKGTVRIGGSGMNLIEHWQFADMQPYDEEIINNSYQSLSSYSPGHSRYYENVLQTLYGEAQALVSGDEGIKSLKLLQAIYDSNDLRKPIFFDC